MYDFHKYEIQDKPYKFVTLSFDDCVTQDIRFTELLKKYGLSCCTFNLNSAQFGWEDVLEYPSFRVNHFHVKPEDVRSVYEGFEVASHSRTHPRLDLLDREHLIEEVAGDAKTLNEMTGQPIIGMAYPGGPYYTDETIAVIRETTDIIYARDSNATYGFDLPAKDELMKWQPTCHITDERIDEVLENFKNTDTGDDMLLYLWGHTYEFDIWKTWDKVEEILKTLSEMDGVTYATNGEIADYIVRNK